MVIGFETTKLRSLCEDEMIASEMYGDAAPQLKAALADLVAAPSLLDLPPGAVNARRDGRYSVDYPAISVIIVQNHTKPPLDDHGCLEQAKVSRVKVMEIEHRV